MFVWARVVCGPRYDQSPLLETSPVSGKIHMQKIELRQGDSTCAKNEEIIDLETFPGPQGPLRDPKSRADAQWIVHMARRTGFREQYYTGTMNYFCAGKIGASNHVKLCVNLCQFSFNNF